jgi:hypothetical protein
MDEYEQLLQAARQAAQMEQARASGNLYSPQTAGLYPGAEAAAPPAPGTDPQFPMGRPQDPVSSLSPWSTAATLATTIAPEGLSMGVIGDEANAAGDALLGRGSYDERLEHYRRQEAMVRERHPWLSLAAEVLPAMAVPTGAARMAGLLGGGLPARMAAGGAAGSAAGSLYGFMEGEGGLANRLESAAAGAGAGGILGTAIPGVGAAAGAVGRRVAQQGVNRAFMRNAPDVPAIKQAANQLYDLGERTGRTADPATTTQMLADTTALLQQNGLITPSGRTVGDYARLRAVTDILEDYAGQDMPPRQMRAVNDMLQAALGSDNPNEARIAGQIMDNVFRPVMYGHVPDYQAADELWRTFRQSELIEQTIDLAGSRAGQFSGSGYENALRTEFRQLERKIIRGQVSATPTEQALVSLIARGGRMENLARNIGRLAPTGVVSLATGAGTGYVAGQALGGLLGGPAMGTAAGVAGAGLLSGLGAVGRAAATRMQDNNARTLSAVVRQGGQLPPVATGLPPGLLRAMEELSLRASRPVAVE